MSEIKMNGHPVTKIQVLCYESIRTSGVINMMSMRQGIKLSEGILSRKSYTYIMDNYSELMEYYDIERGCV